MSVFKYPELVDVPWFELVEPWNPLVLKDIEESGATGLEVNTSLIPGGIWDRTITRPLEKIGVRHLLIYGSGLEELDLEDFTGLKSLNVPYVDRNFRPPPEGLIYLSAEQDKQNKGLKELLSRPSKNLKTLNLAYLSELDLDSLERFPSLSHLRLKSANRLVDATGASRLPLTEFSISLAPRLARIGRFDAINKLSIETCRKLDLDLLLPLPESLQTFAWSNNDEVSSLRPLQNCKAIEHIHFVQSTNVQDGMIGHLADLDKLETIHFQDRAHYDSSRSHMQRLLAARLQARRLPGAL